MADEARLAKLRQLVELDPADSFSRYALAMELKGLGKVPEALEELGTLLERDPDYVATYYQLGNLLREEGEDERAEAVVRQGLQVAERAGDDHAHSELSNLLDAI